MTWWQVSTQDKKSVFEHELYQKDEWVIRRISGFRWGTVLIETDGNTPPVLDQNDGPSADAVDMYNTDYNYELDTLSDGWFEDFVWPDDMPEEERERLLELWEEEGSWGWESEGWDHYETECWFHGPLDIEKSDWQEPGEDEWIKTDITPELQNHFQEALGDDEEVSKPHPTWPFPTGHPNKGE